jgi:hypothetical protein
MSIASGAPLTINPRADVSGGLDGPRLASIWVDAPVRGRGRIQTMLKDPTDPVFKVVHSIFIGPPASGSVDIQPAQVPRLQEIGLLVAPNEICNDIRLFVPLRAGKNDVAPGNVDGLKLRGRIWIQEGDQQPAEFTDFSLKGMSATRPVIWHCVDSDSPVTIWWPDATCLTALRALSRNEQIPDNARVALPQLLRQGLVSDGAGKAVAYEEVDGDFRKSGMTTLLSVLPPAQVDNIKSYYAALRAEGLLVNRDETSDRFVIHNDPVARFVQKSVQPAIARVVGREIKHSYTYMAWYRSGAELAPHKDRPQSKYGVSLLIDYTPAQPGKSPWPLKIFPDDGSEPIEFHQAPGEATFYRGTELAHARATLPAGHTSMSLLFFYVDSDFTGSLE